MQYGYCWYVAEAGGTCDTACGDLGGSNLAVQAEGEWADTCSGPGANDVTTAFFNDTNPGLWTSAGTDTSCHSLGIGYTNGLYHGKCSAGTATACGAYPGETNNNVTRTPVCACFAEP